MSAKITIPDTSYLAIFANHFEKKVTTQVGYEKLKKLATKAQRH